MNLSEDKDQCRMHNAQCIMHNAQCIMHNENAKMRLVLGKVYRIMNAASGDRGSILNLREIPPFQSE